MILLLIAQSTAVIASSALPIVDIQSILSSVANNPTQYLPQYTDNPQQSELLTETAELNDVSVAKEHASTKIVQEVYQTHADEIIKRFQQPASDNAVMTDNLHQVLSNKYSDCQKTVQCAIPELEKSDDFKRTETELAVISEASQQLPSLFQGQAYECRKYGFGFLNCCHDSGWGQFVSTCNQHEIALMQAREQKRGIYLGTKKTGGRLKRKKYEVYCVFGSKIAKIVQEQGRFWQLGIGFGDAESPNCSGMSADELSKIDFDRIDFTEAYSSIQSPTVDLNAMVEPLKNRLPEKANEKN